MSVSDEVQLRVWQEEVARDASHPSFVPLAEFYRTRGRLEVAQRICRRGLERQPEHAEAHYVMGRIHLDSGQPQQAEEEWEKTLRSNPRHVAARRSLGLLLLEKGLLLTAERHLRIALENDPDDPRVRRAVRHLQQEIRPEYLAPDYWDAVGLALRGPIERFVGESRARLALFLDTSGRILTHHGFAARLELAGFASLAAGIHAASRELARMMGQPSFSQLFQGQGARQIFLGSHVAPPGELLLLATFGEDVPVGLVRVLFDELKGDLGMVSWPEKKTNLGAGSLEESLMLGLERAANLRGLASPSET
jgi:tetratricopeptide (TPR) repeat protein